MNRASPNRLARVANLPTLALLLAALVPAFSAAQEPPTNLPSVVLAPVQAELLVPTRALQGTLIAPHEAALAAQADARVSFIAALGSRIEKGGLVASQDDAQARLDVARERTRIDRLQSERRLAERQLARLNALPDAVPAAQRDEAQARFEVLGAQLAEARVALDMTELALDRLQVRAPFAGVVVEQGRQVGEHARSGETLVRLTDLDQLEIEVAVPVELAGHVQPGAEVGIDALGQHAQARVTALVPGPAQTRQLRARLQPPASFRAPIGVALDVAWPAAASAIALTVPMDAVIRRSEGAHLLHYSDGSVRSIPVTLGTRAGNRVAVIGELHPGMPVVVRGGERIEDGAKVRVLQPEVVATVAAAES